jgi:Tfp pilus assembly protein PilF
LIELDLIDSGLAAVGSGDYAMACRDFRAAAAHNPKLVAAHVNLGSVLWLLKDFDAATLSFIEAIAIHPRSADAHMNLGVIYGDTDRLDDAVRHLRIALSIDPTAAGYSNLGVVYRRQNKRQLALHAFEAARAFGPDDPQNHLNCANEYLLFGRYTEGWRGYAERLKMPYGHSTFEIAKDSRVWTGEHVHHLLIHHEQGFGDTIQSSRYIDEASEHCDRLTFVSQPSLAELMRISFAHNPKVTVSAEIPAKYDCFQWTESLLADGGEPRPMPPYLSAPVSNKWRHLHSLRGLRIGLVWAGSKDTLVDARRSMHLHDLEPLLDLAGVSWVSLQMDRDEHDARLYDVAPYLKDWASTAGAMAELDLILSVDTAAAHLAGALGKPVWLLNRFDTCWRWQLDRTDSPWYPTMRIFRQPAADDWESVIETVGVALTDLVSRS